VSAPLGRRHWAIADGYIPDTSHGHEPAMTSHETACLLNASDEQAHLEITVFFAGRDPAGPYRVTGARRTCASTTSTSPSPSHARRLRERDRVRMCRSS